MDEFQLFQGVLHESRRWLQLASDPRRREVSLSQVCRLYELATKLGRLAVGMPTGDEPRRPRKEDTPGYWTGPSVEEALEKIYGSPLETEAPDSRAPVQAVSGATEGERGAQPDDGGDSPLDTSVASSPVGSRDPVDAHSQSLPSSLEPGAGNLPPSTAGQPSAAAAENRRRDAWASWTRLQRRSANTRSG